jgi:hypothetical protein
LDVKGSFPVREIGRLLPQGWAELAAASLYPRHTLSRGGETAKPLPAVRDPISASDSATLRAEASAGRDYDARTVLLVVDVQNDFADPSGSLYVKGGESIVRAVNSLGDEVARRWLRSDRLTGDPERDDEQLRALARLLAAMCTPVVTGGRASSKDSEP